MLYQIRPSTIWRKNSRAFTLIEVVIVLAIVGITTAVIIASLGNQRTKKELETNAREFASVLREAQNNALTGKQLNTATVTCRFDVSWNGVAYSHSAIVQNAGGTCTGASTVVASYSLKQGVSFSNAGTATFYLPWAFTPNALQVVFTKSGIFHTVCLGVSGTVTDVAGNVCP
jgi:prepilin-type N-terminal cleavage/methylation domain-containing protein